MIRTCFSSKTAYTDVRSAFLSLFVHLLIILLKEMI